MAVWKLDRGENAVFEGTVTMSTSAGAPSMPYDLTDATLTLHFGPETGSIYKTWLSGGTSLIKSAGTLGVWTFEFWPIDTEGLTGTFYLFDLWLRTSSQKEYMLSLGTVNLGKVMGTI